MQPNQNVVSEILALIRSPMDSAAMLTPPVKQLGRKE